MALPGMAAEITVAAAASVCPALSEAGDIFRRDTGSGLRILCKSSGHLAKGLKGRAIEADFFISASRHWMDFAVAQQLVDRDQVTPLWGNTLVVAAPLHNRLTLESLDDLADDEVHGVIIGDPGSTPLGRYAKQALQTAGLWPRIRHKVVGRRNINLAVRQLTTADDAAVALIYHSRLVPGLRAFFTVPAVLHQPIRYYGAPLNRSPRRTQSALREFLRTDSADRLFARHGFLPRPGVTGGRPAEGPE